MKELLKEVEKLVLVKSSKISNTKNGQQIEIKTEPISSELLEKIVEIAISNKKGSSISCSDGMVRFYDAPKEELKEH